MAGDYSSTNPLFCYVVLVWMHGLMGHLRVSLVQKSGFLRKVVLISVDIKWYLESKLGILVEKEMWFQID